MNARNHVLILTVGGSPKPLLNAVRTAEPDHVVFLCTTGEHGTARAVDGPGDPLARVERHECPLCGEHYQTGSRRGPSLVSQLRLAPDAYWKREIAADDFDRAWRDVRAVEEELEAAFPDAVVAANYTGGTKTMSAALLLLGVLRPDWRVELNTGPRTDWVKVRAGDVVTTAPIRKVRVELELEAVRALLEIHAYGPAARSLRRLLRGVETGTAQHERLAQLAFAAELFDAWDRFDHGHALEIIRRPGVAKPLKRWMGPLLTLAGQRGGTGYEPVADLIANSDRRAEQLRFDDGVARIYRATELVAQTRLRLAHELETGAVPVARIPDSLRSTLMPPGYDGSEPVEIKVGLLDAWRLLAALDAEAAEVWRPSECRVKDALSLRNDSLMAHGATPLGSDGYQRAGVLVELAKAACDAFGPPRLAPAFPGVALLSFWPDAVASS